jgi:hypothetical protein
VKKILCKYLLFIYLNFIKDKIDLEEFKKWAIPFIKISNFTRSIYIWILSVPFFPIYLFGTKIDNKEFIKLLKDKFLLKE